MGTMIEVKPETAKQLQHLADGKGVSVDELIRVCVLGLSTNGSAEFSKSQVSKVEAFIGWAKQHPTLPPLPDEAVSRKSFYED